MSRVGSPTTAEAIIALVSDALNAIDEGRSAQEVVCAGLAEMVPAVYVAYVQVDRVRHECRLVCWPARLDTERIGELTMQLQDSAPPLHQHNGSGGTGTVSSGGVIGAAAWQGNDAFGLLQREVGCSDLAELPLATTEGVTRLVALASPGDLTSAELDILRVAQRPLMALDSHLQNLERLHLSARRLASADISDPRRAAARFGLTSREMEVLSLLAEGMLARSIAARLELSPRTVQKHLGNMYQKLGTHDRLLTVTRARQLGMLPTLWARGSALQTPV